MWAAACGSGNLRVPVARLKSSLTYMSLLLIHSNRFVQVGLPEMPALIRLFRWVGVVT